MKKACKTHLHKDSKENLKAYSGFLESSEWKSGAGKLEENSGVVQQKGLYIGKEVIH
jgi:hypothetical protein